MRLVTDIDLHETGHSLSRFIHRFGQSFEQADPVERMDAIKQRDRILGLVRLQLADQMQFGIAKTIAQLRPFVLRLLHAVFAKHAVAHLKQGRDPIGGMGFADRDQGDILRLAPRGFAHPRDIGFDLGETSCCTFHTSRYKAPVTRLKPLLPKSLPALWLISDQRNDAQLDASLRRLPRGSGFIYRHYHLDDRKRWRRFCALRMIAKACGHIVILADSALTAREWGADGIYGPARALYPRRGDLLRLATAHNLAEIGLANRLGADAALLSPVYPTRSHLGVGGLGPVRFRAIALQSPIPVIALGGMDARGARRLQWPAWAAIDGLS